GVECLLVSELTNVRYLTGFTGSYARVVITSRGAWFFSDFRYTTQAAQEVLGFRIKIFKKSFLDDLKVLVKRVNPSVISFEGASITYDNFQVLKRALKGVRLKPVKGLVESIREIKDSVELKSIKRAALIAEEGFKEARRLLKRVDRGVSEIQVSQAIERVLKKNGSPGPSFDIIVASGARSALPHGIASARRIKKGEFVIVDMGSIYNGYNSDATRTFVIGKPTKRQANIYRIVKEAHDLGIEAVRPGVKASVIDRAAREHIERAGFGKYFGHGTGHGIGLNVHEGPSITPRSTEKIKEGMIFTIEPGIYIPGFGGVRIEDMVLVTGTGSKILTKSSLESWSL
ncbi:MAG: Xaa-Pro peptidase family protein, partial [Thermodesulfobacteriota bacterium]